MAGTTPRHNLLTTAITSEFHQQHRKQDCCLLACAQRLAVEATGLRAYPDVLVTCPPYSFDVDDPIALTDATVIAEILTRSMASYDRTAKFDNYKYLPSLRHYLLVEQERIKSSIIFGKMTNGQVNVSRRWKTKFVL